MATKKAQTADQKKRDSQDTRKAKARFMDQPGQWEDVTPKATRKKQDKAWKEYEKKYLKKK
jgi:hypothetical protein